MLAAWIQSVDLSYRVGKKTIGLKQMQLQGSSHTESLSNWQNEGEKGFLHSVCGVLVSQSPWVQYVCQPWLTGQTALRQGRVFADTISRVSRNVKCSFCWAICASGWQLSFWSMLGVCFRQKCQRLPHQTDAPGMSQVFGRNEKHQYSVPDIFDGTGQQGDMVSEKLDHDIWVQRTGKEKPEFFSCGV